MVLGRMALSQADRDRAVDQCRLDAVTRQQGLHDIEAGAEQHAGRDQMVAGLEMRQQPGARPRPCRSPWRAGLGPFEPGQALLEHAHGRIAVARIDEAAVPRP